jgi:glutaminyl-tRNA synthetase
LYDRLFADPNPEERPDFVSALNPNSLEVVVCKIEPSVDQARPGTRYQFERQGYFCVDLDSTPDKLLFNRTVPLRDSWAKIAKQLKQQKKK